MLINKLFDFFNSKKIKFLCIILISGSIYAQEDSSRQIKLFTPSVDELLQIPVKEQKEVSIASNIVKDIDKQPASVTVISREQIRLSGARTLKLIFCQLVLPCENSGTWRAYHKYRCRS